ncbi:PREDICTED: uncharacterized protein LOC109188783 isoform X2 [Ipomoea nil]|uniref:uncharacterized protein LOC109188783 isoform X2 n=1 Tax=Ipomoea nil TaxID=35883 RepID=UPI000900AD08|nr:PREDICTED: uncharacterized protein LOC109188783 isoform X2 [Ipomoea nil]
MGFEGFSFDESPGAAMRTCTHKRSKSFPDSVKTGHDSFRCSPEASPELKLDMEHSDDCFESKKKQSSTAEVQSSLTQEIMQLEKRLQTQVAVRCALEKALGYRSTCQKTADEISIPKPATELIREIAVLEFEVGHLEQYLLSLYRKAFDQQISTSSPSRIDDKLKSLVGTPRRRLDFSDPDVILKSEKSAIELDEQPVSDVRKENNGVAEDKLLGSAVHRSHSSLPQHSALSNRTSPLQETPGKAVRACHSQPISMMENASSNIISLAEHLGARISDHVPVSPNKLSEDMIKCMCTIYCKLAEPAKTTQGLSSPTSSLSSISAFSPKDQCETWSPGFRNDSSFDVRLDNPFHVEGLKEFSGPYSSMVEVQCIYRDNQKLGDIEPSLQNFKSLISRLEEMDPRKLTHEEKLAFWINVHNALVMHAFLAYGVPQNSVKRAFLLLKAAYNVGGHIVSADVIQNSILGCRMPRPAQWVRLLLSSKGKFKAGDERQAYVIERPEPLVHFALCSGNHSDPAVRVYTPKRILQELEAAKEEYIRATFGVRKDHKILLPKIVESFAKHSGLCPVAVMEMLQQSLPDSLKKSLKKCQQGKARKSIEWVPHSSSFRYLILKELVE